MAKKKKTESLGERLGDTVTDMVEAVSFAATGSSVEVLEAAAEDEMKTPPVKRAKKKKVVAKRRLAKKANRPVKKKRSVKRAKR
jgi:hypothetical protein